MVATPGSGGSGSGARAMTYRDKMVKAHDKFWPEVDKVEPILTDLESKLDELSQSHLTVMGPGIQAHRYACYGLCPIEP